VNGIQSRIAILAINNAGTIELAAVNMAGGVNLDETDLISTTAEGGAGAADSATVIYSTTARTNVAYRVIGYVESTQATAGTWATTPSKVQPAGGNAMTAMSSIGYGQNTQIVTRTSGVTYYNSTGKPITVMLSNTSTGLGIFLDGIRIANTSAISHTETFIVKAGGSYSYSGTLQTNGAVELR